MGEVRNNFDMTNVSARELAGFRTQDQKSQGDRIVGIYDIAWGVLDIIFFWSHYSIPKTKIQSTPWTHHLKSIPNKVMSFSASERIMTSLFRNVERQCLSSISSKNHTINGRNYASITMYSENAKPNTRKTHEMRYI